MEWLILALAVAIAFKIALTEALQFVASPLSQDELERRAEHGDKQAKQELKQRQLIPLYFGLQRLMVTVLVMAMVGVLAIAYPVWMSVLTGLGLMLLVGVVSAHGWLRGLAGALRTRLESHIWKIVKAGAPLFRLLAPRQAFGGGAPSLASKDELKQLIEQDQNVLNEDEKTRLLSAIHFSGKAVADAMVPRTQIATVGAGEPVGPLLLDKLHKMGHNIIVAVKKDLDHVVGLLYMTDLVPLDPEIEKVKDAIRPSVYFVPASAPLENVLAASVKTGRQLFLVADTHGKVVGLITLADALEHLVGNRLGKDALVGREPKDVH